LVHAALKRLLNYEERNERLFLLQND
jgi:hypothetical protein